MPVYFFHLRNKIVDVDDEEGVFLPDLEAAKQQALRAARDTLCQDIRTGAIDLRYRIEVSDSNGKVLHTIKLGDAFTIIPENAPEANH